MEQEVGTIREKVGLCWRYRILTLSLSLLSLFIGGCLYLMYRSDSLVMFEWCKSLGIYDMVINLRPKESFGGWIVYSLPDGLWLLSYVLLMGSIWNFNLKRSLYASAPLAFIAVGSELLQIPGWVPGTFDVADLFCYLAACGLGYLYLKSINHLIQ